MVEASSSIMQDAATELEQSGLYRVLRPLPSLQFLDSFCGLSRGLFVDVETTGLDPEADEIIQFAAVEFGFSGAEIVGVRKSISRLREPSIAIPEKITRLTGIDDNLVRGRSIDRGELEQMLEGAEIVVAHHAAFDRPFVERLCPAFRRVLWGCSMTQVPWQDEGYEGVKLSYLVAQAGYFYGAHDAEADCRAALAMLALPLPVSRETGFSKLANSAFAPSVRVWAVGAPFGTRHVLKSRGYRWHPGGGGRPKAWYRDMRSEESMSEVDYLVDEVCVGCSPIVTEVNAIDRFSGRL